MSISHSHRRTKRRWNPNIQRIRVSVGGTTRRAHVCTSCIRADKITKAVMEMLDYGEESVSVAFEEVDPQDWAEEVYKPDIVNSSEKVYKKPGYTM